MEPEEEQRVLDRPCQHQHTQRCLFTEGKWWEVCQECGVSFIWMGNYKIQRHFGFDLEL